MKRVLYSVVALLLSIVFIHDVQASTFDMVLEGDSSFESEITLNLKVGTLTEFETGLYGLTGYLNYDSEKIELISIDAVGDFDLTYGSKSKKVVLYNTAGVDTGTTILTMKFKNLSLIKDETTTISLNNLEASDGNNDIEGTSASKTIKFIVKEEVKEPENTTNNNTGSNSSNNNSQSNNNSTNNTSSDKKEEETVKSDNNYLSSLTLSNGTIKFSKDVLTYDVVVDYDTTSIEIKAKAEDEKAIVDGTGKHDLKVGSNKIILTVKAENDSERTYTINVNREEKDIVVNNDVDINEDKDTDNSSDNNYILYGIIGLLAVIIVVLLIVMFKKKNK